MHPDPEFPYSLLIDIGLRIQVSKYRNRNFEFRVDLAGILRRRFFGKKIYEKDYKLIKKAYVIKTHNFYEKHGGKAVIIARFIPIIRTFAPFVAGAGTMKYPRFIIFSIFGTTLWVFTFCSAGYFFANNAFVKSHFSIVVLALILIPAIPALYAILKQTFTKSKA